MPRVHSKQELASIALAVAARLTLVSYRGHVYEARDFETGDALPDADRAIWVELTSDDLMDMAQAVHILFQNQTEFENFKYMVRQGARRIATAEPFVMVPHDGGLGYLTDVGIVPVETPAFTPNFINYTLIEKDSDDYEEVTKLFAIISNWVGGDEQAHSLLYHLSTALQPGYSAVKYVLLIGEGRNGKGTLLAMLYKLLGDRNISGVFRQDMAARRPTIRDVNGKLANIVFDGPQSYVADSAVEKTIVAGEPVKIEMKYENEAVTVQTNALFVEGLNKEPKNRDKSPALQKRLARFFFDQVFVKDLMFELTMTSRRSINALLTLLWEHWVDETEIATKLELTAASHDLQITQTLNRSAVLAWIEETMKRDDKLIERIKSGSYPVDNMVDALQPWMQNQGYEDRTVGGILDQLQEHFKIERKTHRPNGRPITQKVIARVFPDTLAALSALEGEAAEHASMVREE